MRIVPTKMLAEAGLSPSEGFFVELWYSMTHRLSLDSYRVRCLNAHGIIRELNEELRIARFNEKELPLFCDEVAEILQHDSIIDQHFSVQANVLLPLLPKPSKGNKEAAGSSTWKQLRYVTEDFLLALDRDYFDRLCDALSSAIGRGNENEIRSLLDALLGELIARGWPLESLFRWHVHFLTPAGRRKYTFDEDLAFMLLQLRRGPQVFRVTLRLLGSKRLAEINTFHDFRLTEQFTISGSEKERIKGDPPDRFLRSEQNVVFATTTISAVDEGSAAIEARTAVEDLLDLLRFDYEPRVVRVDRRCLVRREGDGRTTLLEIRHVVPNPRFACELDDFNALAEQVDSVLGKKGIDAISRQQLEAGIRQYRFGSDAESYRDKFLAWWMGLEALTNLGNSGSIGAKVAQHVACAMLCDYLHLLLRDLLATLKHLRINWPAGLAGVTGCAGLNDLTLPQLLQVLQAAPHAQTLWDECAAHPTVVFRGKQLQSILGDPKKLHDRLVEHQRHLEWHLARLYRIRCCIVHGSPVRFNLALFAANLEFYLKELIRFVLINFKDNDHIETLDELFHRAASRYERVKALLESAASDAVRDAVFMGIVVRPTTV